MKTLYNSEGDPVEVPDDDEIQELKSKAESISKLEEELKELKNKPESINWKAMREKENRLVKQLKEKGVELDENGEPIVNVDPKFVESKAEEIANRKLVNVLVEDALDEFGDARDTVFETFQAITQGKEVSRKNYREFLEKAARAEGVLLENNSKNLARRVAFARPGGAPESSSESFADSAQGRALGEAMGLPVFLNNDNK